MVFIIEKSHCLAEGSIGASAHLHRDMAHSSKEWRHESSCPQSEHAQVGAMFLMTDISSW
jgi:hypothetical protein